MSCRHCFNVDEELKRNLSLKFKWNVIVSPVKLTWKKWGLESQVGLEKVDLDVFSYRIWNRRDRLELRGDIEGLTSQLGVVLKTFSRLGFCFLLNRCSPQQGFSSTGLLLDWTSL